MAIGSEVVRALAIGLCVSALAVGSARAEDTDPKPESKPDEIEENTVRARKVEEPQQSTPVAVTPFDEAALEREVAYDLEDLQGTPNVLLNSVGAFPNATAFSIRGGSFQDIESSFEPAIGVVQDGIYIGRNATSLLNLYDTESVEVVRGPQGVHFGRNTTSGMVVVRSRRPSGEFGSRGQISFGDRGFRDYRLALDFPVVPEKVAANVAILQQQSSGHFPNSAPPGHGGRLGSIELWAMRGMLQFTPTDSFDLTVIWDNLKDRSGGAPLSNASPTGSLFDLFGFGADGGSLFSVSQEMHERNHTDLSDLIFDASWDVGPVTLTSITGWRSVDEDIWTDFDAEPLVLFETKRPQGSGQFSEELRLSGDVIEDVLGFTLGWFYYDAHYSLFQSTDLDVCVFVPGCPSGAPGAASFQTVTQAHQSMYSNGYFGQLIWSVTPKLNLYAGGRWTIDDKQFDISPPDPVLGGAGHAVEDDRWHKFTPKIGMDFQVAPDVFTYMQYSTGFRSGGFNGRAGTISPASVGPYDPETRGSLETGVKSDWLDNRLRINLTGFYDRFRDMQLPVVVPTGVVTSPQETVTRNAASAQLWGLELETIAKPIDPLTIWADAGYLNAKYLDFSGDLDGDGIATDNSDLALIRAPRYYGHIEAVYQFQLGDVAEVDVDAQWTYIAHYSTTVVNASLANVPATSLYDGSVTFRPLDSAWRFTVYGKNLLDREVIGGGLDVAGLFAFNAPIPPRTYGVQVGWQYDDLGDLLK